VKRETSIVKMLAISRLTFDVSRIRNHKIKNQK